MLTTRQRLAYKQRCDLWQPSRPIDSSTGVVGGEVFTLAYSNVACCYQYTDNISDVIEGAGRVKRPTVFTTDEIHFDAAQEVAEGWIARNKSILPDGSQSPLYGECHMMLGSAKVVPSAGNRRANKRALMAQVIEQPPASIT